MSENNRNKFCAPNDGPKSPDAASLPLPIQYLHLFKNNTNTTNITNNTNNSNSNQKVYSLMYLINKMNSNTNSNTNSNNNNS
jgi:hypothetical protein